MYKLCISFVLQVLSCRSRTCGATLIISFSVSSSLSFLFGVDLFRALGGFDLRPSGAGGTFLIPCLGILKLMRTEPRRFGMGGGGVTDRPEICFFFCGYHVVDFSSNSLCAHAGVLPSFFGPYGNNIVFYPEHGAVLAQPESLCVVKSGDAMVL